MLLTALPIKLTLSLFLPHEVAEYVSAGAIREGKNTPASSARSWRPRVGGSE
jgi:hypothetical protein